MYGTDLLKYLISKSTYAVFLGGAGVSTESGIPDFRSETGLYSEKYNNLSPEIILSHDIFVSDTQTFYDYYKNNMLFPAAKPNAAHIALRKLEERGILKAIITQNIDGLHQLAGSKNVIELHGSVIKNECLRCGKVFDMKDVIKIKGVPCCDVCGGIIKPKVVLYGENLNERVISDAINNISRADLLIVGGTSLMVNPAASFIKFFRGKHLVIINKTPTPYDGYAELVIREPIAEVLKKAVE